jgi:enediyne biosynthesis protein E3
MNHPGRLALRRLFGISPRETTFSRRGFRGGGPEVRRRLEGIGSTFVLGYHAALEESRAESLDFRLRSVEAELRGFAYEGAAMGLALLDFLTPWRGNRFRTFLEGPGAAHAYMMHVGAGWLPARLGLGVDRIMRPLDRLLRWLVVDGYGFHDGYFRQHSSVSRQAVPVTLTGYARRAFDQGLGRSLWFVEGAEIDRISATIAEFAASRRGDLWSGVGLACAYAGGTDQAEAESLLIASRSRRGHVAQGAAFAAKARQRAGNPAPHTENACRVLCAMSAAEAATVTDDCLDGLADEGDLPAYEVWRTRIRERLHAPCGATIGEAIHEHD